MNSYQLKMQVTQLHLRGQKERNGIRYQIGTVGRTKLRTAPPLTKPRYGTNSTILAWYLLLCRNIKNLQTVPMSLYIGIKIGTY